VLANHSGKAAQVWLSSRLPLKSASLLDEAGVRPLPAERDRWRVGVPAYGGAVVEWSE
jgi:hypothetical protein